MHFFPFFLLRSLSLSLTRTHTHTHTHTHTQFLKRKVSRRAGGRTCVLQLTSRAPYRQAKPAHNPCLADDDVHSMQSISQSLHAIAVNNYSHCMLFQSITTVTPCYCSQYLSHGMLLQSISQSLHAIAVNIAVTNAVTPCYCSQ